MYSGRASPGRDYTILRYHLIGGGDEWTKYDYDVGTTQMDTKGLVWEKSVMPYLAPCRGKFYSFFSHKNFAVLEFNPLPTTRVKVLDGIPRAVPPNPGGFMGYSCGFEMDGQLCRFFAYYYRRPSVTTSIALYKLDVAEGKQWRKVDEIGDDRALLWSGRHAASCSATRFGLEPNCVYWINWRDCSMRISNILENTERICEPSRDLPKDLPKLSSEAFWLLPMK
ncbi:hypothetical protein QOZ80_3AG0232660 [Eleusine coracana subsp. coracana]|nr:hypothetical protein QOZ80_3AG0232660 [Eleusine coracana subsp. coracana]